jgi:fido (protein-threonine AMPylation protein)
VPGPAWNDDNLGDATKISTNCDEVLRKVQHDARTRAGISEHDVREWHRILYQGCAVSSNAYVGNFRGDTAHRDLTDYEVDIGRRLSDGYPEKMGMWARDVAPAVTRFFRALDSALTVLDQNISQGTRPQDTAAIGEIITLAAAAHGEWLRIHPFANGNGRTARLIANAIALRYGLPAIVALRPRPAGVQYLMAAQSSMGRPPDFQNDHSQAVAAFTMYVRQTIGTP